MKPISPSPESADPRAESLWRWFAGQARGLGLGEASGAIQPVSGDASFRRYFRGRSEKGSWILVDAPVTREDSKPFVSVQAALAKGGVRVPAVIAADLAQGFMCLEDFGAELLWTPLEAARRLGDTDEAMRLYGAAFDELLGIQRCDALDPPLPLYDAALLSREIRLFGEWLCRGILGHEFTRAERQLCEDVETTLIASALAQPTVFVHRDYHSRNLMVLPDGVGVIDFQDAVLGPYTYDLVSLLKDCYIAWEPALVKRWALQYLAAMQREGIVPEQDAEGFWEAFELMGMQRHLKAAGIFCRLFLRDGKPGYLGDVPRTLSYITALRPATPCLLEFIGWLQDVVMPALPDALDSARKAGEGVVST